MRRIRFLSSDVAIMIAVGGTVMAGQSNIEPERNSIHTLVAIKRDSGSKFESPVYWEARDDSCTNRRTATRVAQDETIPRAPGPSPWRYRSRMDESCDIRRTSNDIG